MTMPTADAPYRKKLIEVALPLDAINRESAREKSIRHGHPSTLHLWWARRPLAAARAVLFGQLVDDPSAWPELFPTEAEQDAERQRLFFIIEELVKWENSNKESVLNAARREIARSHARSASTEKAKQVLAKTVTSAQVNEYLVTELPPVHDPFAGGGTIPLEAQRLGLRAIASDLNPVSVLINKALIEIPPMFAGRPPINPESRQIEGTWKGAQGLAEDIRYYGKWIRDRAFELIGHLYPELTLPVEYGHGKTNVIAWLWARTIKSPNPASKGVFVPLITSYWLAQKKEKKTWIVPIIDQEGKKYEFTIRTGQPVDEKSISAGTKIGRGQFKCILSNDPIDPDYIRAEAQAGRMGYRLMAIVLEGKRGRIYLPPSSAQEELAACQAPDNVPDTDLPEQALGFRVQNYGIRKHKDLFTPRQLTFLHAVCSLLGDAHKKILEDHGRSGDPSKEEGLKYADAISVYMACAISRCADFGSTLCMWSPAPKNEVVMHVFGRHTLSMTWDFAEANPFSDSTGNWLAATEWVAKAIQNLVSDVGANVCQSDAGQVELGLGQAPIISTDPPYYDNVPYADLSDYFYIWIRHALKELRPDIVRTILVPKAEELVAEPYRHGGQVPAEQFFLNGMKKVISRFAEQAHHDYPVTIYYAFKQAESDQAGVASTGWETFLQAINSQGFAIDGTWPVRTERPGRLRDSGSNALASSIVLVCRRRMLDTPSLTRGEFRRILRKELPFALRELQKGNTAPVDMAQASIGPGMAIFSRHSRVLEADGTTMEVRTALQLINEALDEFFAAQEGELDPDTRFAITWFETNGWNSGAYGDAETLAKARNISVTGVAEAGLLSSVAGKVRLLKRSELPETWHPATDDRLTVWESTQHLIKRLEEQGEEASSALLKQLGPTADLARDLSYRLYSVCERRGWAEDARAYNSLITAWPELEKLAQSQPAPTLTAGRGPRQGKLF